MVNRIINEINRALDADLYLVALMAALSLPDICGSVEYPNLGTTARYKKWYSKHIGKCECSPDDEEHKFPYASADVIYNLRCSLVHNGNPSINYNQQNIKLFILSITKDFTHGGASICMENGERALEIGIRNICWKLCFLANKYYEQNKEKFKFDYTIKDYRKNGL